ncbi:MAG: hypothetical protein H8D87_22275 [Deltaproteobacteria bacterium]|uniref:hypothetical protein n=1 Tax=Desulfobacula sp. TaxID=2593537 RepID=UPI00198DD74E|nr:hypothetical protein [Candidatus Desulfobacula maris]MBL6993854.1 hypothetical protein [Desulfobacula sp.]
MNILHTSDRHIGRSLYVRKRYEGKDSSNLKMHQNKDLFRDVVNMENDTQDKS